MGSDLRGSEGLLVSEELAAYMAGSVPLAILIGGRNETFTREGACLFQRKGKTLLPGRGESGFAQRFPYCRAGRLLLGLRLNYKAHLGPFPHGFRRAQQD